MGNLVKLIFFVYILTIYNCEASCYYKIVSSDQWFGCLIGNQSIALGATELVGCVDNCRCVLPRLVQCCLTGMRITGHPDDCKVIVQGCTEIAVKINDESVYCEEGISVVER
ncbi:Hypothetical predicted protein [Mytilus galloprovincialis]|uniref:Uncharacterized protein n=1 Tax=Mytilus galloprovincialis TaxID=29158 RepID=A0A8B6DLJ2_MYTGA|nr:Hypothetical predicted protein [Mytilus galloprovincialis]